MGSAASAGSALGSTASTAGSVGSAVGNTASALGTAGETASAVGSAASTASNAGTTAGALGSVGSAAEGAGQYSTMGDMIQGMQGPYEAGAGYSVQPGVGMTEGPGWFSDAMSRMYTGSQGTFGDAVQAARDGNYMGAAGYGISSIGGKMMELAKGGGQPAAAISSSPGQPNPDNSYLQRLRKLQRGF